MRRATARLGCAAALTALTALVVVYAVPTSANGRTAPPRSLYVANGGSGSVTTFGLQSGGGLMNLGSVAAGSSAASVAANPDSSHLYVTNWNNGGPGTVSSYAVDTDGMLHELADSPVAAGNGPAGVAVSPAGSHLYVANRTLPGGSISVYRIRGNGSLREIGGSPFTAGAGAQALGITPDGRYLYTANFGSNDVSAVRVARNGSLALVGSFAAGVHPRAIGITPDGSYLYVANRLDFVANGTVSAFAIGTGGSLTPIAGSPFAAGKAAYGIAISPSGTHVYVPNALDNTVSAYSVGDGGALVAIGTVPVGTAPTGIAVTPDGGSVYVSNNLSNDVYAYDIGSDGSLSQDAGSPYATGGTGPSFGSVAINPNQPPVASFSVGSKTTTRRPAVFDASASFDRDGSVTRYDWSFGDGTTLLDGGSAPSHSYAEPGRYTVKLHVTDDEGCSDEFIFTGQTAHCNGARAAVATVVVKVVAEHRYELKRHAPG